MPLRYCARFAVLALAGIALAGLAWPENRYFAFLVGYASCSFAALAYAYGGGGAKVFRKKANGQHAFMGWLLFAPYFLLNSLIFHLYRIGTRETATVEVLPNLHLGRRLTAKEAVNLGCVSILDLAAEFPSSRWPRTAQYRSLPILDATAPSHSELQSAIDWIANARLGGRVYVHCALGHGRSACVVIAYLISIGKVATIEEGIGFLQILRPGVRLHAGQQVAIQGFLPRPS